MVDALAVASDDIEVWGKGQAINNAHVEVRGNGQAINNTYVPSSGKAAPKVRRYKCAHRSSGRRSSKDQAINNTYVRSSGQRSGD